MIPNFFPHRERGSFVPKLHGFLLPLVLFAVFFLLVVLLIEQTLGRHAAEHENGQFRLLISALLQKDGDGSCGVRDDGPRVLCAMKDGQLYRTELKETDQLVTLKKRTGPPLKHRRVGS